MKKNKKIISFILCFALAVSLLSGALTSSANENIVYEECTYVNQFRKNESGHIDEASYGYPAKDGYVFAGWYKKDGNAYIPLSQDEADETDGGYAKYVKKEVLGIKYQFERNRTTGSETIDLRMLTSVDCLDYKSVGFIYSIGGVRKEVQSDTVYERVIGYADSEGKVYEPSVFSTVSKYFMSYTVNDIAKSEYGKQVELIPKWVTNDGTVVIGKGTVFTLQEEIADFYNGLGFENEMDQQAFTGQGQGDDALIDRVAYENLSIDKLTGGENHALRIRTSSSKWPKLRINFGEELQAGTQITFMAYGKLNGESSNNVSIFEFWGTTGSGDATVQFANDTWTKLSMTLKQTGTYVDLMWNIDRAVITSSDESGEVYIDNVMVIEPAEAPGLDITQGVDFEDAGEEAYITGKGAWNDVATQRVTYSEVSGIPALNGGDQYLMKLTNENSLWPALQINFGKELEAGTEVSFMVYGKINGDTTRNKTKFEFIKESGQGMGLDAGSEFNLGEWTLVTMSIPETTDKIYLCWNMDHAGGVVEGTETGELYIDNLIATVLAEDITQGVDFEDEGEEAYITGKGAWNDMATQRVTYGEVSGIPALDGGNQYLMKLTNENSLWPALQINFGKELEAGTEVSFMVYGKINGDTTRNKTKFEFIKESGQGMGLDAGSEFNLGEWTLVTMSIPETTDKIYLCWNMDHAGGVAEGTETGELYIDNLIAIAPTEGITQGVDFEDAGEEAYITGKGAWNDMATQRVTYGEVSGIPALDGGNQYLMKLTNENSLWPALQINFGKELEAGTEVSFMVYGKINGDTTRNKTKFEFIKESGQGMGLDAGSEFNLGEWTLVTMSIPETTDKIYLCWNMDHAGGVVEGTETGELYIDNLIATVSIEDITQGVDFEEETDAYYITGTTPENSGWRDAFIERVPYATSEIALLENGGNYALKLRSNTNMYPTFRINFGKELPAGTQITFSAYAKIYEMNLYNHSMFKYLPNEQATELFKCGSWETLTITLTSDCNYIDMFWDFGQAQGASLADGDVGEVYIDNIVVSTP